MVRTVVSLEDDDKRWLDEKAAAEGVPMTELVRRAVRMLRDASDPERPGRRALLEATRGTWKRGDGLAWQEKLRAEWRGRPH